MLEGVRHNPARRRKTLWTVAAGLSVVVLAITAGFFFKENRDLKKDPNAVAQATSDRVIDKVGELYILPNKEKPTVAKIENKSKLEGQSFFLNARNGDYLLVYGDAKIALLYREEDNKLVNVGPVNTEQNQSNSDVAGENTTQP
jgi:hypothetical protein